MAGSTYIYIIIFSGKMTGGLLALLGKEPLIQFFPIDSHHSGLHLGKLNHILIA